MTRPTIIEPVTRRWTLEGEVSGGTTSSTYDTLVEARRDGLQLSCLSGSVTVDIVGADGALLCFWCRADNRWRDLCRGVLTVAEDPSCSCGAERDALTRGLQEELTLGWYWLCRRCGASAWSHIGPN